MKEDDKPSGSAPSWLADGGQMGERIRAFNWSATPLGPVETWSPALRMMVRFLCANRFPLLLWWGPKYVSIYNDAYRPILGSKHPWALGQPVCECWKEIWHVLKPLIDTPYHGGPSTWNDDIVLEINRHGFAEETHFTVAYSPVPDETVPSGIGGVLATVHETTGKVIGDRRVVVLRDLWARSSDSKTPEEACVTAAETLAAHAKDIPFALLYLISPDRKTARLAASAGVTTGVFARPNTITLEHGEDGHSPWPLAETLRSEAMQVVINLSTRLAGQVPPGPWGDPPDTAVVVPIHSNRAHWPAGLLVAGISARLQLDDAYRDFLKLVSSQIATSIANAREFEEEKKRAEALAEIDHAKTTFFSNVSHEFRTPLTLMLGPLKETLANVDGTLPARASKDIATAYRNARRLLRLVNTLLDFSRVEAGRIQAKFEPVDLAAFTTELASVFRSAIEKAGLQLNVDCSPLAEPVYVDREMWEKIVLNLLSNAFKFTFAGEIAVTLQKKGSAVELRVRDTGAGIPDDEMPRVFERFHRVPKMRSRTHEGSGIGLALVHELVKLHGGSVGLESRLGEGSIFTVSVPLGKAHLPPESVGTAETPASTSTSAASFVEEARHWLPEETSASEPEPSPENELAKNGRGRDAGLPLVLVADDNADMRQYLTRLLSDHHTVLAVPDGESAFKAAREHRPDLILSDIMMPGLDGIGLLRKLRAEPTLKTVPIIFLSARAGEESRVEGLQEGADDYLVKPFSARELLARVAAHLALGRLRNESVEAMRESEERFRALVEASSDVVYRMNPDWTEMRLLVGRRFIADTDEPSRTWLQKYIHPDDQQKVMAAIQKAIREKSVFKLEHRVLRVDGTLGWTFSRAIPVEDKSGEIIEWFGMASDLTERKQAETMLRENSRRKDEFLAMLAHELRNPLAAIRNAGQILSRTDVESQSHRLAAEILNRQVAHMVRQVDDLLDVSRLSRGMIELRKERTELAPVVNDAVEASRLLVESSGLELDVTMPTEPLYVQGDAVRLGQAIGNLLNNACKFTDKGGHIWLTGRQEGDFAVISIRDSGIGIMAKELGRIFDIFTQLDRSLERTRDGLGLGLTLVKNLVELHGGTVEAHSLGLSKGSEFIVRLPLSPADRASAPLLEPRRKRTPVVPRRVLVVDDHRDSANSLATFLRMKGHEVETAYDGLEAVEKVGKFQADVILLDLGMPHLNGYEVAQRIREQGQKGLTLIAVSGWGQDEDRRRSKEAGFNAHLIKPVDMGALQKLIAEAGGSRGKEVALK